MRSLVVVGAGRARHADREATKAAGGDYQVNSALELFVADEAHVDHVKIVSEGTDALHVSTLAVAIGAQGALQRV